MAGVIGQGQIPKFGNLQLFLLLIASFFVGIDGADQGHDICSPCQMQTVTPSGANIETVTEPWIDHLQGVTGTKCYYPFENDPTSLQLTRSYIEGLLALLLTKNSSYVIALVAIFKYNLDTAGDWEHFLSSTDQKFGGCHRFYAQFNDKGVRHYNGLAPLKDYTGPGDAGRRKFWLDLETKLALSPLLPIQAVYNNYLDKYKGLYRDQESFCRVVAFTDPNSRFGRCPAQYTCGLVDIPSLNPIVENLVNLVNTGLRYVDPADTDVHRYFNKEDKETQKVLTKVIISLIDADDRKVLANREELHYDLPCIHLNHEYRAIVKRAWKAIAGKMETEKKTTNGLRRHFGEILKVYIRSHQPLLRKFLADGTEFQFRQLGDNCGCSVPFLKTIEHIKEIVMDENHNYNGFRYKYTGLDDITDITEINFFYSIMASCDFGLNLECSDKCKCICPGGGTVCNASPPSHQFTPFKIINTVNLFLIMHYIF